MVFKQRFLSELYVVFCLFHYIDVVMSVAVTQSSHGLQLFTATPASSRAPNPQNNLDLNYLSLSVFFFFFFWKCTVPPAFSSLYPACPRPRYVLDFDFLAYSVHFFTVPSLSPHCSTSSPTPTIKLKYWICNLSNFPYSRVGLLFSFSPHSPPPPPITSTKKSNEI